MNRYLFVLADRRLVKLIFFYDGILEDILEFRDIKIPQEVKSNKNKNFFRSDKFSRDIHEHLNKHLKLISEKVNNFIQEKPINAVFIGGHAELVRQIKKYLNKDLQRKCVGEFTVGLKVFQNEILRRCEKEILQFERRIT